MVETRKLAERRLESDLRLGRASVGASPRLDPRLTERRCGLTEEHIRDLRDAAGHGGRHRHSLRSAQSVASGSGIARRRSDVARSGRRHYY
jgi:hypothetical protein